MFLPSFLNSIINDSYICQATYALTQSNPTFLAHLFHQSVYARINNYLVNQIIQSLVQFGQSVILSLDKTLNITIRPSIRSHIHSPSLGYPVTHVLAHSFHSLNMYSVSQSIHPSDYSFTQTNNQSDSQRVHRSCHPSVCVCLLS